MKFDRLRQPAISALAILTIGGAGVAMAANDSGTAAPAAAAPAAAAPAVQAVAPAQAEPVEPTGPDTDLLQEGDQTTPDVAPATTTSVKASTSKAAVQAVTAAAPATPETGTPETGAPETGTEPAGEAPGTETDKSDGPGGHADDPNDPNADHQFEGQE